MDSSQTNSFLPESIKPDQIEEARRSVLAAINIFRSYHSEDPRLLVAPRRFYDGLWAWFWSPHSKKDERNFAPVRYGSPILYHGVAVYLLDNCIVMPDKKA